MSVSTRSFHVTPIYTNTPQCSFFDVQTTTKIDLRVFELCNVFGWGRLVFGSGMPG